MTLHAACYGQAYKDAEIKSAKSGNSYGTLTLAVANGQDDEGREQHVFIRLICFQEHVYELAKIKKGDRVYAEGSLTVGIWQGDKGPRPDLSLKAHHVRRTAIGKDKPKREREQDHSPAEPHQRERQRVMGRDDFGGDPLPF
jgi:single-stranded DNA-binding protein